MKDKKLKQELPGHADEVFALDWALDGSRVASGGKDKVVKMLVLFWKNVHLFRRIVFYNNFLSFFSILFSAGLIEKAKNTIDTFIYFNVCLLAFQINDMICRNIE